MKIRIAVNVKTKKILAMDVTDEHVHDSKALPELIENIIKSNSMTAEIGKLIAEGVYDSNDIYKYLGKKESNIASIV